MSNSSTFAPLRIPIFRALWIANIFSNSGRLIQAVGAAWLMTTIADSVQMVALVQASTTLPVMVFALVSGALADNYDRRRVMLVAQLFMFMVSLALVVCTYYDFISAWGLLGFTFLIGCGMAINIPSWNATVGDIVVKQTLPAAVLLNSVGFNVTRSVAPAIGGSIVAAAGAVGAFAVNTFSYIGLIGIIWRWHGTPPAATRYRESLRSAITAGVRYVALSPNLVRILFRAFIFGLTTVIVLALLPLITRELLQGDALTFGILLGAYGIGAVGGGLVSERLSPYLSSENKVRFAFIGFAVCATDCALSTHTLVTALGVLLGGASWVLALSLFNTSVQLSTPRWVVGRALSLYQMSAYGGMALGSWWWGIVAEHESVLFALIAAAVCMLVGAGVGLRWRLPDWSDLNLDPINRWHEPKLALDLEARSGPISVSVLYAIEEADTPEFLSLMQQRQQQRRRNGARQWTLLRDIEQPQRWMERFKFPTWADYVRFHEHTTHEDAKLVDRIHALHQEGSPPTVLRTLFRDPARGLY